MNQEVIQFLKSWNEFVHHEIQGGRGKKSIGQCRIWPLVLKLDSFGQNIGIDNKNS